MAIVTSLTSVLSPVDTCDLNVHSTCTHSSHMNLSLEMGLLKAIYLSELPLNFVAPSIAPVQPEKGKMQKLEDVLRKKSKELSTRTNSGKSSFRNKLLVSK